MLEGQWPALYMLHVILHVEGCQTWPGPRLYIKTVYPGIGIPTLKIRRSRDRLIFNMGIPILVRQHLYTETVPRWLITLSSPWWRHPMETFSALLAIWAGNSPVNSPHKIQWRGALMFSLICAWIRGWVNDREAGDLRRHRAHYDVTVMI